MWTDWGIDLILLNVYFLFYEMHILFCHCSLAQSCLTICDPMNGSMPGFPVLKCLPEFAQTHVHWVIDVIQPPHPCCPLLLLPSIFLSIRVFSSELVLCIRWPKYWSFNFSISPSNKYSGLISFRIDWFDLFEAQGTLKSLLQHQFENINSWALSLLYGLTLTSIHGYWKSLSFDCMYLCRQNDVSAF